MIITKVDFAVKNCLCYTLMTVQVAIILKDLSVGGAKRLFVQHPAPFVMKTKVLLAEMMALGLRHVGTIESFYNSLTGAIGFAFVLPGHSIEVAEGLGFQLIALAAMVSLAKLVAFVKTSSMAACFQLKFALVHARGVAVVEVHLSIFPAEELQRVGVAVIQEIAAFFMGCAIADHLDLAMHAIEVALRRNPFSSLLRLNDHVFSGSYLVADLETTLFFFRDSFGVLGKHLADVFWLGVEHPTLQRPLGLAVDLVFAVFSVGEGVAEAASVIQTLSSAVAVVAAGGFLEFLAEIRVIRAFNMKVGIDDDYTSFFSTRVLNFFDYHFELTSLALCLVTPCPQGSLMLYLEATREFSVEALSWIS